MVPVCSIEDCLELNIRVLFDAENLILIDRNNGRPILEVPKINVLTELRVWKWNCMPYRFEFIIIDFILSL